MTERIQSQFINPQNGTLYYEVYFKFIINKEIDFSDYQRIERIINLELINVVKQREAK